MKEKKETGEFEKKDRNEESVKLFYIGPKHKQGLYTNKTINRTNSNILEKSRNQTKESNKNFLSTVSVEVYKEDGEREEEILKLLCMKSTEL